MAKNKGAVKEDAGDVETSANYKGMKLICFTIRKKDVKSIINRPTTPKMLLVGQVAYPVDGKTMDLVNGGHIKVSYQAETVFHPQRNKG